MVASAFNIGISIGKEAIIGSAVFIDRNSVSLWLSRVLSKVIEDSIKSISMDVFSINSGSKLSVGWGNPFSGMGINMSWGSVGEETTESE